MEKQRPCREYTIIRMFCMIIIIVTKMVIPKQSAGTALRNPHRFLSINSLVCTHSHTNTLTHSPQIRTYITQTHKSSVQLRKWRFSIDSCSYPDERKS